jgi:tetratricopeptide (TPR) repeat protein
MGVLLIGCSAVRRQIAERRQTCDALCQQAKNAKNEGWPDQADLLLNEAVRQRPDDLESRRQLAEALWECGRQQEAIAEYRELIQVYSRDLRLHQRLAVMAWSVGEHGEAARAAERALRLDPTCTEALLVKARSEAFRRDFDAAMSTYIRLSRAAPNMIEAKLELAEVHVERGYSNQACTVLRDVLAESQLTPEQRADAEWKLGLAYASEDRWQEAATHLSNSIEKRDSSNTDWQMAVIAKTLAGHDTTDLLSRAQLTSATIRNETSSTAWMDLRDRMLVRGQIIAGAGSASKDSVIRADFSKSVQADAAPTNQY